MSTHATTHWHILGAGAIGALLTQALIHQQCPVTWILRDEKQRIQQQQQGPVQWQASDGTLSTLTPTLATPDDCAAIDHLLVTTKVFDAALALADIRHLLTPSAAVVLMTNGMGLREEVAPLLPKANIYNAITSSGAHRVNANIIQQGGIGKTLIGHIHSTVPIPDWFRHFSASPINADWSDDIETAMLQKLAVNCAINPLTAIHGCRNGELHQPLLRPQLDALCQEISAIFKAAGHRILAAELASNVQQVIADTADNRSSMLQDVSVGKSTEIQYITGYLLTLARQWNVPAPLNFELYQQLTQR